MTLFDRLLRRWRIAKAQPYIRRGTRVLDIGCGDEGTLLVLLRSHIAEGVGIDPSLPNSVERNGVRLIAGKFPDALPIGVGRFDAITLLAVLEHLPHAEQVVWAQRCISLLNPGGHVVVTVPSPSADRVLHALVRWRIMQGTALHEHYGFDVNTVPVLFSGLNLLAAKKFEWGFNNLFVFQKPYEG